MAFIQGRNRIKTFCLFCLFLFGCSSQTPSINTPSDLIMTTKTDLAFVLDGYENNGLYIGYTKFFNPKNSLSECFFIRQQKPTRLIERICANSKQRIQEIVVANKINGRVFYKCNNPKNERICFLMQNRIDYLYKTLNIRQ